MSKKDIFEDMDDLLDGPEEKGASVWDKRKGLGRGRPKAISTPELLWDLAQAYFEEVDENPFMKQEVLKGGPSAGKIIGVPTIRPYTWKGFENYLFFNKIASDLEKYRYNFDEAYGDYVGIITCIGSIIYTQKFEGASVGAFNANIIARELGLSEKTQSEIKITEQPLFGDD